MHGRITVQLSACLGDFLGPWGTIRIVLTLPFYFLCVRIWESIMNSKIQVVLKACMTLTMVIRTGSLL